MNRRTALKFSAAMVLAPTLNPSWRDTITPRTPDGESWDSWAAVMSELECEALADIFTKRFGKNWPDAVSGGWLLELGNYKLCDGNSWWDVCGWGEGMSLFWIVHPTRYALDDLENAVSWYRHVGVPVLGTGGTSCGRVACCYLNKPQEDVLGVARVWRLSQWEPDEAQSARWRQS